MDVSPLVDSEGPTHTDDKNLSELLSDQFSSVFSRDDGLIPELQGPRGSTIDDITFTANDI